VFSLSTAPPTKIVLISQMIITLPSPIVKMMPSVFFALLAPVSTMEVNNLANPIVIY